MQKIIETYIPDEESAICVPFDMGNAGTFSLSIHPDETECGDIVVLKLDKEACKSFANIFIQLAYGKSNNFHIHMGLDETPESTHGFRIELK